MERKFYLVSKTLPFDVIPSVKLYSKLLNCLVSAYDFVLDYPHEVDLLYLNSFAPHFLHELRFGNKFRNMIEVDIFSNSFQNKIDHYLTQFISPNIVRIFSKENLI